MRKLFLFQIGTLNQPLYNGYWSFLLTFAIVCIYSKLYIVHQCWVSFDPSLTSTIGFCSAIALWAYKFLQSSTTSIRKGLVWGRAYIPLLSLWNASWASPQPKTLNFIVLVPGTWRVSQYPTKVDIVQNRRPESSQFSHYSAFRFLRRELCGIDGYSQIHCCL